ncbi:leucyl aminopeptidase family protein [Candidatus Parcubacteria bacterium]|nr:MAG: leucyl aminopeptidase family protein [Candidatus Parcubacteria bacterium]
MAPNKIKITFSKSEPKDKKIGLVSLRKEKDNSVFILSSGQKSIVIGVPEPEKITRRKLILLTRQAIVLAKQNKIKRIAIRLADFGFRHLRLGDRNLAELLATNFEMANFEFVKYKTPPPEGWNFVEEVVVVGESAADVRKGFEIGQIVGGEVNACRVLANTPGGDMTPRILGEEAKKAAKGTKIRVKVLGKSEIQRLKMGGVLGVARGSAEKPTFIILEYWGAKKSEKPVVLVGKGVTFDSGGLNLKPSKYISEGMHLDMSGGAAVIHSVVLAAKLRFKKNVIGLVPAAENMVSGSSYRPGDVLRTMSGKTIEIGNTDAEGRVILADALTYAKRYDPRLVVDVATLTGLAMLTFGAHASALLTRDGKLEKLFRELGEESGDYVWPLPMWEEYESEIKGTFGDVFNTNAKTDYGGTITGAMFLYQFVKDSAASSGQVYSWVHIDMAPRMTAAEGEYLTKGAAGAPVRLLIKLLERY